MSFEEWFKEYGFMFFMEQRDIAIEVWQAAQPQWQDLDTAPTDGTIIKILMDDGSVYAGWHNIDLGTKWRWCILKKILPAPESSDELCLFDYDAVKYRLAMKWMPL
jgi:hypothetical protein